MRPFSLLLASGLLAGCASGPSNGIISGVWSGSEIRLTVLGPASTLQMECASATVNGWLSVDSHDSISVPATLHVSYAGPSPIKFVGHLNGDTLTVALVSSYNVFTDVLVRGKTLDFGNPICPASGGGGGVIP